jgi:hypothetical protein
LVIAHRNEVIMRRIAVIVVVTATWLVPELAAAQTAPAAAASARPQTVIGTTVLNANRATLSGVAITPMGQPVGNAVVQARNLLTGQIGGSATTASTGQFAILGLNPGNYIVEIVDRAGQIIGTSSFISAAAGTAVGVTVTATTGTLSAVSTVTGLAATLGTTAAESVKVAATAAGLAGVVVPAGTETASASR